MRHWLKYQKFSTTVVLNYELNMYKDRVTVISIIIIMIPVGICFRPLTLLLLVE